MTKITMDNMTKKTNNRRGGKASYIYENFFEDEKMETLSIEARYLVIGLIARADLWGIFPATVSAIRRNIFFADTKITDKQIDEWLKQLQELNIIHVYQGESELHKYLILVKWQNYQYYQYIPIPKYPLPPNWKWVDRWAAKYEELYGAESEVPERLQAQHAKAVTEEKKRASYTKEEKAKIQYVVDGFFAAFQLPQPKSDKYRMYVKGTNEILAKFNQDEKVALENLVLVAKEQRDRGGYYWKDKWTNISALANSFDSILGSIKQTNPITQSSGGTPANKVPDIA